MALPLVGSAWAPAPPAAHVQLSPRATPPQVSHAGSASALAVCLVVRRCRRGSAASAAEGLGAAGSSSRVELTVASAIDYFKCPKLYERRHVASTKDPRSPHEVADELISVAVAEVLSQPVLERATSPSMELLKKAWDEVGPHLAKSQIDECSKLAMQGLQNYFKLEDPLQALVMKPVWDHRTKHKAHELAYTSGQVRLDAEIDADSEPILRVVGYTTASEGPGVEAAWSRLRHQAWHVEQSGKFTYSNIELRLLRLAGNCCVETRDFSDLEYDRTERAGLSEATPGEIGMVAEGALAGLKGEDFCARAGSFCHSCAHQQECPARLSAVAAGGSEEQVLDDAVPEDPRAPTEGVTIVSDREDAERVLKVLMELTDHYHAIDTETTDWTPGQSTYGHGRVICFSVYCGDDVDFGNGPRLWVDNMDLQGNSTGVLECFRKYLEDPSLPKVFHNYSFDRAMFYNEGISVAGFAGDTMHMARLEHSDRSHYSLQILGETLVGPAWGKQSLGSVMGNAAAARTEELHRNPDAEVRRQWIEYSTFDTVATWKLHERLMQLLSERTWQKARGQECGTLLDYYEKYWCPFGEALVVMESRGVPLDLQHLRTQEQKARRDLEAEEEAFHSWIEDEYRQRAPEDAEVLKSARSIVPSKAAHIKQLLFGEGVAQIGSGTSAVSIYGLGLPDELATKRTPLKKEPVLGGGSLEEWCGPDPANGKCGTFEPYLKQKGCVGLGHLSQMQAIKKANGTFLEPLQKHISSSGRLHSSFNIHTCTGRLTSSNPNLQQLPALDRDIYQVRGAIRCSPDKRLIVADYGQLDIRVLAHISSCGQMIESLRSGIDFHTNTALRMYPHMRQAIDEGLVVLEDDGSGLPLAKDRFPTERRHAKAVNFGIAYGLTPYGLANQLGCAKDKAQAMIDKWHQAYPEVKEWQTEAVRAARELEHPCVATLQGRQRRIDDLAIGSRATKVRISFEEMRRIQGAERQVRISFEEMRRIQGAERQAINAPVQGGSADVVVEAMVKAHQSERLRDLGFSMILQVHDELVFEGPAEAAEEALQVVRGIMEHPFLDGSDLDVPLPVDAKIMTSWSDAKGVPMPADKEIKEEQKEQIPQRDPPVPAKKKEQKVAQGVLR